MPSPVYETLSNCDISLPNFTENISINEPAAMNFRESLSPTLSSSSSLSLSLDVDNNFLLNHNFIRPAEPQLTYNAFGDMNSITLSHSKQDVSVGTELTINRDLRCNYHAFLYREFIHSKCVKSRTLFENIQSDFSKIIHQS